MEPSATDGHALLSEVGADDGAVDTEHRRQFLHALARLVRLDESDDLVAAYPALTLGVSKARLVITAAVVEGRPVGAAAQDYGVAHSLPRFLAEGPRSRVSGSAVLR